jgi:hypothetical protein
MDRDKLRSRDGERFRIIATFARSGLHGDEQTVLLTDIVDAETGEHLVDHVWLKAGEWIAPFMGDDRIAFDARVTSYVKGYLGARDVVGRSPGRDWKFERPTKCELVLPSWRRRK